MVVPDSGKADAAPTAWNCSVPSSSSSRFPKNAAFRPVATLFSCSGGSGVTTSRLFGSNPKLTARMLIKLRTANTAQTLKVTALATCPISTRSLNRGWLSRRNGDAPSCKRGARSSVQIRQADATAISSVAQITVAVANAITATSQGCAPGRGIVAGRAVSTAFQAQQKKQSPSTPPNEHKNRFSKINWRNVRARLEPRAILIANSLLLPTAFTSNKLEMFAQAIKSTRTLARNNK